MLVMYILTGGARLRVRHCLLKRSLCYSIDKTNSVELSEAINSMYQVSILSFALLFRSDHLKVVWERTHLLRVSGRRADKRGCYRSFQAGSRI